LTTTVLAVWWPRRRRLSTKTTRFGFALNVAADIPSPAGLRWAAFELSICRAAVEHRRSSEAERVSIHQNRVAHIGRPMLYSTTWLSPYAVRPNASSSCATRGIMKRSRCWIENSPCSREKSAPGICPASNVCRAVHGEMGGVAAFGAGVR
jgi:hypothetical protein